MSYNVRYTRAAREDLTRLYGFLLQQSPSLAQLARTAIGKAMELLTEFPFSCRKVTPDNPFLRELLITFGSNGYVALFEIETNNQITILALRHQREEDYY